MWRRVMLDAVPWTLLLLASVCSTHASPAAAQMQPLPASNKDTPALHSVLQSPENTAVVADHRTSFICISNTSFLNWAKAISADSYTLIASGCMLNQDFAGIYALENVAMGRCDLVVLAARSEDAGTYLCMETIGFDRFHTAQLAVIDAEPVCSIDNEDPRYGDDVTLTCDVSYTDNISPMLMTWTDEQGNAVPSSSSKSSQEGYATSSLTFTVTSFTLPQYTCTTKFSDPVGLPSTATNTPAWTHEWTSPALSVRAGQTPQNAAGVVGDSVKLTCHMQTQEVIWNFVSVNQTSAIAVVVGCKLAPNVGQKYRVESEDGACNLVIDELSSAHAGTYTCQDFGTANTPASAELIVHESTPICSPDIELREKKQQLTCSVTYSGNFAPVMTWTDETGAVLPSTTDTTRTRVESRVTITSGTLQEVTSTTQFEKPSVDQPGHVEPATNAPDYTYSWTTTLKTTLLGDCSEHAKENPDAKSGVYTILIPSVGRSMDVYCDMDTDGGGWTVFQRRQDGSVVFFNDWATYVEGFGKRDGEFWLGNDNLAALTGQKHYVLRVDLGDWENNRAWAKYSDFKVLGAADKYKLSSVGLYTGTAGDSLSWHLGFDFSTYDQNNGPSSYNCAASCRGAWWYHASCHVCNLNGEYNNRQFQEGVNWHYWTGLTYSLKFTEMKIRPDNY